MPHYQMPDGEQLYVREYGQGQPVLVLSGLGMQSWQWSPFFYTLRKQFKFIIPDWRGFGGSKNCAIPDLDAISSHWRDIDSLLQQLNIAPQQLNVIAYSMGATTAMHGMQYAHFSKKLKSYLHIDQTPKIRLDPTWQYGLYSQKQPQFLALLMQISSLLSTNQQYQNFDQLPTQTRAELLKLWLAFIELQATNRIAPLLFKKALKQKALQAHLLPMQRLDYLAWYINNYLHHQEDYRAAITQLECPATFFIGAQSQLYPADGQKIVANSVKNATAIIFEKSGHTPLISEPIKFHQHLHAFLKQQL